MSGVFETPALSDGRTVRTLSGTGRQRTLQASDGTQVTVPKYLTNSRLGLDAAFNVPTPGMGIYTTHARPVASPRKRK